MANANVSKIKLLTTTYDIKDNSGTKSTHTHTKDQITDFPVIPTKDSDLTNDRYVRYDTNSQGLNATQKANARTNIGAGTSSFSGSYNDLTNKPTIPTYTSQLTNDSGFISESALATVATSGSYNDLTNKPTISSAGNASANAVVSRHANGSIQTEKLAVSSGTTTKATIQYNTTDDCIDFIFS